MLLLVVAVSCAASLGLTNIVRTYTLRRGVLDRPNARSSHSIPTPRGGGLALIAASVLGIAVAVVANLATTNDALILTAGMLALGAVGWLDDTRGVRPGVRLVVHGGVAVWTVYMFGGLPSIHLGNESLSLGVGGYLIGVVGIVWGINLFNFMDGIDGLAGSQAVLIFGTGALLLVLHGDNSLGAISASVAAAAVGFLAWNWPPAKIFLGDAGSGVIGYLVAALAIASENHGSVPLIAFAILSGLFITDATITLLRRVSRGERPTVAHRDHAYQRLTRAWGSHRVVTARAASVTLTLVFLAYIGTMIPRLMLPVFVVAYVFLTVLYVLAERRAPMQAGRRS